MLRLEITGINQSLHPAFVRLKSSDSEESHEVVAADITTSHRDRADDTVNVKSIVCGLSRYPESAKD